MESLGIGNEEDEDEFLFLDPNVDPKDLCPYCDTLMPPNPTPHLRRLLSIAKSASNPDPRPTNPLGRKATILVYIDLCQRHRFESVSLPKARKEGWKEIIEWEGLRGRVECMRSELEGILKDADEGDAEEQEGGEGSGNEGDNEERKESERRRGEEGKGARKRCIFWREVKAEVKRGGVRGAVGVREQLRNYEKSQPGYYGEQGSAIIQQTLYTMFPLASIDPSLTHPLTPTEFHQRILVPQVGLLLIREDLNSSMKKALKTMRESTSYGVAMFPDDGDEDDAAWEGGILREEKMGIADKIALERARKRKKELEVEEQQENEAFKKHSDAAGKGGQKRKSRKQMVSRKKMRSDIEDSVSKWKAGHGPDNNSDTFSDKSPPVQRHELSPVAKAIVVQSKADPALKQGLSSIIRSKGFKTTDMHTIESYPFAVTLNE